MLTIQDNTIKAMMSDQRFLDLLPCLRSSKTGLQAAYRGCGSCQRKKQAARRRAYAEARNCISRLPADKRNSLKKLLGADKVRVVRRGSTGAVKVTF